MTAEQDVKVGSLELGDEEAVSRPRLSFSDDDHPSLLLHSVNLMRKDRTFCDVVLQVGKTDIPGHRCILAALSPHLMELFSSEPASNEPRVTYKLNGVFDRVAIEKLVDFAYTSRLELDEEEVKSVYVAAAQLKIERVARRCAQFLVENLAPANAIDVRALPGIAKDKPLAAKIDDFIRAHFDEIVKSSSFLCLSSIPIEVLSQSEAEREMVSAESVCRLAWDWLTKAHEESTLQELTEKTHMLYLALDNSLQDCSELPSGDVGDTDLVQDYKRLSRSIANGNKQRKKKAAANKPRVLMYSRNISNDGEPATEGKLIAATDLKDQTLVGLGFLSGRAVCVSVVLRLNSGPPSSAPPAPDVYDVLPAMDTAKCAAGCANLNGSLFVCGGYDRGECLKAVELYSPLKNVWTPLAPMLEARGRFNIAVIDGKVYAVGGCNGTTELSTVEVFSEDTRSWERLTSLPSARSNLGVCNVGDLLYCIGGYNGQSGIRQCDVYHPKTNQWVTIAPLHTGRYQCGCCGFGGEVWAAGGSDGWSNLTSVEVYDPEQGTWRFGPPMTTPRRGCGLALFNGKLYAVGGADGQHSLASTEVYDPARQSWSPGPDMSVPRANVGVAVIGRRLYAVGGFSGKTFLNSIEFLEEGTDEWNTFSIKKEGEN